MSVVWSDEEIGLLEALRPVCNSREIQTVFGLINLDRSMEAISKKGRQLGITFKDFGVPALAGLNEASQAAVATMLEQRERSFAIMEPPIDLTTGQKSAQTAKLRDLSSQILASLKEIRNEVPRTSSVSVKRKDTDKESLVICYSDNHFGRIIRDDDGEVIYNFAIAAERVEKTPEMLLGMLTKEQKNNIDEVIVLMVGDHVDGEGVFPAQEMMLEDHVAEQCKRCVRSFWLAIKALRKAFPMVRVITCRGNHGRGGISPDSNWDVVLYQQLELLIDLEGDPNLTIKNKYGEFNTVDVRGWKGMIRHKAPQQSSTAAGAIKFAGWQGIHNWDFFVFGHFHNWGVMNWCGKPIVKNGSAMGADDYSESLAVNDGPVQVAFIVSEDHPIKFMLPVYY